MSSVPAAVAAMRRGDLVVLPTETVYGLAADASNARAVARIYEVKGRPAGHPLILHVADIAGVERVVNALPQYARKLAAAFWPGPLTLVLQKSESVAGFVTGGQDTVAVRVPNHPVAQDVLQQFGRPVAAPSANRFGRVSPTSAEHVRADIGELLHPGRDVILDGGLCQEGVESTIVDCTGDEPRILRPGSIGAEQIREVAGALATAATDSQVRVSGSLPSHYAPQARVVLADSDLRAAPLAVPKEEACGLIALSDVPTPPGWVRLAAPETAQEYAHDLYAALRQADSLGLSEILAVPPPGESPYVAAVRDRLQRAAADPT